MERLVALLVGLTPHMTVANIMNQWVLLILITCLVEGDFLMEFFCSYQL